MIGLLSLLTALAVETRNQQRGRTQELAGRLRLQAPQRTRGDLQRRWLWLKENHPEAANGLKSWLQWELREPGGNVWDWDKDAPSAGIRHPIIGPLLSWLGPRWKGIRTHHMDITGKAQSEGLPEIAGNIAVDILGRLSENIDHIDLVRGGELYRHPVYPYAVGAYTTGNDYRMWDRSTTVIIEDVEEGRRHLFSSAVLLSFTLNNLMDWIQATRPDLNTMTFAQAVQRSRQWHQTAFIGPITYRGPVTGKGRETIVQWPDGAVFERILSKQALEEEGSSMNHCVGGYWPKVRRGESLIYSYRDAAGVPQITIEVKEELPTAGMVQAADLAAGGFSARTHLSRFSSGHVLQQFHGPQNQPSNDALAKARSKWVIQDLWQLPMGPYVDLDDIPNVEPYIRSVRLWTPEVSYAALNEFEVAHNALAQRHARLIEQQGRNEDDDIEDPDLDDEIMDLESELERTAQDLSEEILEVAGAHSDVIEKVEELLEVFFDDNQVISHSDQGHHTRRTWKTTGLLGWQNIQITEDFADYDDYDEVEEAVSSWRVQIHGYDEDIDATHLDLKRALLDALRQVPYEGTSDEPEGSEGANVIINKDRALRKLQ